MAELTEQQKLEIHNKLYQAGKGMIPVQELTYAASQLCKDNSEANQVEVLRDLKQFSMPGVGTSSAIETIAAEAVRDAVDRGQPIEEIMEEMGVIEHTFRTGEIIKFGRFKQSADSDEWTDIEWYVLHIDEETERAVLVSKYVLDYAQMYTSTGSTLWRDCSISLMLNDPNSSTAWYKTMFTPTELTNVIKHAWQFSENNGIKQYIFCLSERDISQRYTAVLNEYDILRCQATNYAIQKGLEADANKYASYWAIPDTTGYYTTAKTVLPDGTFSDGINVRSYSGIRPVIEINITNFQEGVYNGNGL